jgi:hypothetical protein
MVATLPSCSRTKVMPVYGAAGANVSREVSPENSPGPSNDASRENVFCRLLTRWVYKNLTSLPPPRTADSAGAAGECEFRRNHFCAKKPTINLL